MKAGGREGSSQELSNLSTRVDSRDRTLVIWFGDKRPYPLSYLVTTHLSEGLSFKLTDSARLVNRELQGSGVHLCLPSTGVTGKHQQAGGWVDARGT